MKPFPMLLLWGVFACSAHDSTTGDHDAEAHTPDTFMMDGGTDSTVSTSLAAPVLDKVAPMHGGLHVQWTNVELACETIELERKDVGEYRLMSSVPGEVDNKHDATVKSGTMYTYRLRCKKMSAYSNYSNEVSAAP